MKTIGYRQQTLTSPKWKWQNIHLLLYVLLGVLTSCETEESFYQSPLPQNKATSTRQAFFEPKSFFAYTDSTLKAAISALHNVEEEEHFITSFLLKYGIPLWNFSYKSTEKEETCIFVPLYRLDKPHSIDAIWLLRIKDGWMKFFPLRRDNGLIKKSDQMFIFDLLSYMIFGEENAQGLIFKPHAQTRGILTITQCWDVYTGTKDHLEYSYTNCIEHSYWVDDRLINNNNWNTDGGGSGDVWIGGSGGSGSSSPSSNTPAGSIFKKEIDQDSLLWQITENMMTRIMEDCLGGNLYNLLREELKNRKINIEFDFGKGYSYNWDEHTIHIGLEELEANNLLHEMFHVFQTTQEHISSFRSSMMNKEIEAHYAQYLFLKRSVEWTKQKKKKYTDSQRLRATTSLAKYINQQGYITTSDLDFFNVYLSNNIVSSFRNEGYENYPFKEYPDITKVFPNIKLTTKNCNE